MNRSNFIPSITARAASDPCSKFNAMRGKLRFHRARCSRLLRPSQEKEPFSVFFFSQPVTHPSVCTSTLNLFRSSDRLFKHNKNTSEEDAQTHVQTGKEVSGSFETYWQFATDFAFVFVSHPASEDPQGQNLAAAAGYRG